MLCHASFLWLSGTNTPRTPSLCLSCDSFSQKLVAFSGQWAKGSSMSCFRPSYASRASENLLEAARFTRALMNSLALQRKLSMEFHRNFQKSGFSFTVETTRLLLLNLLSLKMTKSKRRMVDSALDHVSPRASTWRLMKAQQTRSRVDFPTCFLHNHCIIIAMAMISVTLSGHG